MQNEIFGYMWLCSVHEDCIFNKEIFPVSADFSKMREVEKDPQEITLYDAGKRKHYLVMATGVVPREKFLEYKEKTKDRLITECV